MKIHKYTNARGYIMTFTKKTQGCDTYGSVIKIIVIQIDLSLSQSYLPAPRFIVGHPPNKKVNRAR